MKKILVIFSFIIFLSISIFANSFDDDCVYLENLFSDVAIDISLSLEEKKLTAKDIITEIKSDYIMSAPNNIEKENEIDNKAFADSINKIYAKYSYKNSHVSVSSEEDFFIPFEHQFVYFSNIYVTKENDTYIVSNNYKKIKKGMIFTGNM